MPARNRLLHTLALSTATLALAASLGAPHMVVASPGGFTLPTATPTPTSRPEVEGPADDTGPAPLAPRVITQPTPTPTPVPTPAATPSIAPTLSPADTASPAATDPVTTGSPTIQPLPTITTGPTPGAPTARPTGAPAVRPPGAPVPAAPISADAPAAQANGIPGLDTSGDIPVPQTDAAPALEGTDQEIASTIPVWAWIAGGLAVLAALIAGLLFLRRRQAEVSVPEIERPQVPVAPAPRKESPAAKPVPAAPEEPAPLMPANAPARIDIELEIVRATRSVMNFTVDYRLILANRTDGAVRDVSVSAILTSAQAGAQNPGGLAFDRPDPEQIARIGPNKSHAISGQAQLPTAKLQVLRQGNTPLFVPLLQVTVTQANGEPVTRHYVIGQPSAASSTRLHPIPLNTPPGGIPGLRARELDIQPA